MIGLTWTLGAYVDQGDQVGDGKRPKPRPSKQKTRQQNCSKQTSPVWRKFKNARNTWKTDGTYYYKWDPAHNDIEKYDRNGRHLGSVDPSTGKVYRGRQSTHDLPKSKRDW